MFCVCRVWYAHFVLRIELIFFLLSSHSLFRYLFLLIRSLPLTRWAHRSIFSFIGPIVFIGCGRDETTSCPYIHNICFIVLYEMIGSSAHVLICPDPKKFLLNFCKVQLPVVCWQTDSIDRVFQRKKSRFRHFKVDNRE